MFTQHLSCLKQSNRFIDINCGFQRKKLLNQSELDLIYQHKALEDNCNEYFMGYRMYDEHGIKIDDEFRTGMQIFIKTIDGKMLTFEIQHSNRIRDIKLRIKEKGNLSTDEQCLFFQGEILDDDDKTIDEYEICDQSVIDVVARMKGGMQIFIRTLDQKQFTIEVRKTEKIIDIKKKIQEKIGLHPDEQKLIYQGGILEDDKTVDEYQIGDKSRIDFVARLRPGMQIFAKTMDGKTVAFEADKTEKIIDIKKKIQEKIGLHPDEQKLIYQAGILEDDKTIDEYQIGDKAMINVVAKLRGGMEIFAKTMDGKRVVIEVQKSERISDIKRKIQEKIGLHRDDQILIYQAGILDDDDKTVDEYQIVEKSVITVDTIIRNGIRIFIKTSNKSIIPINIVKTDKTIDLKSKIAEKTGMQLAGNNNLIYENKILDNDKLLIDYQIDDGCVLSIDIDSEFLLFLQAIKSGSLENVQNLYDSKFHQMKNSPLHYACKLNNADIVEFLIKNNFKINAFDSEYNMPIHYACINNSVNILETLIRYKCNFEVCDAFRMKPIHLACLSGNFQHVKLLIENGCNLESKDYMERRPIHLACLAGNIDIMKLLIQNKCEIDILDKSNKSPFNIAEKENRFDMIEIMNEEISRRRIENMISELDLNCSSNCDHKFCQTSLCNKTFKKGVKIRKGGTGKVYQCKLSKSSHQISIKQIPKDKVDSKSIEGNINKYVEKLNYVRIIKYFGAITLGENIFIFMEFMNGGSLRTQISTNPPIIYSKVIHYSMQILEGLQFLHKNKIIHRNIKPDHILLDNNGNVKLTDFTLGLSLSTTDDHTTQTVLFGGSTHYMAPEIINNETYSYGVDIWALGISMIEMATGKCPFQELPQHTVAVKIVTSKTIPYQLPASPSNNMKLFIDQMLLQEPSRRPSATDLINKLETMK